jgi:HSP20 family protein
MLTLSGERRFEKSADKDAKQHRVERYYGTYSRSFSLPDDVQAEQISADYKDGVLSVHLPKAEAKKSRKVEVRVQ